MDKVTEWKTLLRSGKKLEREHGVDLLQNAYAAADDSDRMHIEGYILDILRSTEMRWEETQGALMAAKVILLSNSQSRNAIACAESDSKFDSEVKVNAVALLEHSEYAVRITAGK